MSGLLDSQDQDGIVAVRDFRARWRIAMEPPVYVALPIVRTAFGLDPFAFLGNAQDGVGDSDAAGGIAETHE